MRFPFLHSLIATVSFTVLIIGFYGHDTSLLGMAFAAFGFLSNLVLAFYSLADQFYKVLKEANSDESMRRY